jgi:hypothetical protein
MEVETEEEDDDDDEASGQPNSLPSSEEDENSPRGGAIQFELMTLDARRNLALSESASDPHSEESAEAQLAALAEMPPEEELDDEDAQFMPDPDRPRDPELGLARWRQSPRRPLPLRLEDQPTLDDRLEQISDLHSLLCAPPKISGPPIRPAYIGACNLKLVWLTVE